MDEHEVQLFERTMQYESGIGHGLTTFKAEQVMERDGPNQLSPPKTTPKWIKFCANLFDGFEMVLWIGAIFCVIAYGIDYYALERPSKDNLYLVMVFVVVVAGVFQYCKKSKSSKIMESRINLEQSQIIQTQATSNAEHEAEIFCLNSIISTSQLQVQDCVATNAQYKKVDDREKKKIQELTAENLELKAAVNDLQQKNYQMESTFAALKAEISVLNVNVKSVIKEFSDSNRSADATINQLTVSNAGLQSLFQTKDKEIKEMEEEIRRLYSSIPGLSVEMEDVVVDSRIDYKLLSQKILKVTTCQDISNVWTADAKYITLKRSYRISLENELLCWENSVSTLLEYVYACNLKKLVLINQQICLKEYQKLLASEKIEEVEFRRVQVMGEYDELLRIDEFLKDMPNIQSFVYEFRDDEFKNKNAAGETSKKLDKLLPFRNLRVFRLFNLQKGFKLRKFIKKNPDTEFIPPKFSSFKIQKSSSKLVNKIGCFVNC